MTRRTNGKIAGVAYLLYIVAAFPSMVIMNNAMRGAGLAAHASDVRIATVLSMLGGFCALTLAVTLWAITRPQDPELAMLGLTCRVAEGVIGAASLPATLALLALATTPGASAPDPGAMQALTAFVMKQTPAVSATFFAVGSTLFCWLLLRGRMIPISLAWLGVVGSALVAVAVPVQVVADLTSPLTQLIWIPIAIFEITVAFWFLITGVAEQP